MDVFDAINKRHSYRGPYRDQDISRDDLEHIVRAALKAPSGRNMQTTQFVIVNDPGLLKDIAALYPSSATVQQARAFIACVTDQEPETKPFQVEDCAAAVENMLLAITALGYASVWIDGWLRAQDHAARVGALLGVPEEKVVRILLPVGIPAEERAQPPKKPFEERAWFNRYGG